MKFSKSVTAKLLLSLRKFRSQMQRHANMEKNRFETWFLFVVFGFCWMILFLWTRIPKVRSEMRHLVSFGGLSQYPSGYTPMQVPRSRFGSQFPSYPLKMVRGTMKMVQGTMKMVRGTMKMVQGTMKMVWGSTMKMVRGTVESVQKYDVEGTEYGGKGAKVLQKYDVSVQATVERVQK